MTAPQQCRPRVWPLDVVDAPLLSRDARGIRIAADVVAVIGLRLRGRLLRRKTAGKGEKEQGFHDTR